jgi:hypothetical protein
MDWLREHKNERGMGQSPNGGNRTVAGYTGLGGLGVSACTASTVWKE